MSTEDPRRVMLTPPDGGASITIPLSQEQFERLSRVVLNGLTATLPKGQHVAPHGRSRFRNPEIARRADELVDLGSTIEDIRDRLLEEFGEQLAPSRSAVGRYARNRRLRRAAIW